ncbi:MAG TPA: hypothetical protein DD640_01705 [Clostridiales bacterium]|nr:hypothetical protein [Clostridiales bacterium]
MTNPARTELNQKRLADFVRMSRTAGSRSDYVQGGGGNTSCKLDSRLMAIKASGFRLDQIAPDNAYAVLDYAAIRAFYENTDPSGLADVEKEGSAQAKAATQPISGLPQLRPSVEAGFHSLLDTYVLHTHAIYANLATCASEGAAIVAQALNGLDVGYAFVPYINPGAQLTFAINKACRQAEAATGRKPSLIFMQNHGLVVTDGDADTCLNLHDEVNERIAAAFQVKAADWPEISLSALPAPANAELWQSETPWLQQRLLDTPWDLDLFTRQSLYPDQLVFLSGQVGIMASGSLADALASGRGLPAKCTLFSATGEVCCQCGRNEAQTIIETLCAIFFITRTIRQAGYTLSTMNEAGKNFISNWESEKYRHTIAAK